MRLRSRFEEFDRRGDVDISAHVGSRQGERKAVSLVGDNRSETCADETVLQRQESSMRIKIEGILDRM